MNMIETPPPENNGKRQGVFPLLDQEIRAHVHTGRQLKGCTPGQN